MCSKIFEVEQTDTISCVQTHVMHCFPAPSTRLADSTAASDQLEECCLLLVGAVAVSTRRLGKKDLFYLVVGAAALCLTSSVRGGEGFSSRRGTFESRA